MEVLAHNLLPDLIGEVVNDNSPTLNGPLLGEQCTT